MSFTVTTLMENTSPRDCLAKEHGLSLLIEGAGRRVLYDTGLSPRFLRNAAALKVDLQGLDALVFSHGHCDHTGGTAALLAAGKRPKEVYLGRDFFLRRYGKGEEGLMELSALVEKEWLDRAEIPCHVVGEEPVALGEGLWLLSGFTSEEPIEPMSSTLLRCREGVLEQDPFQDEVAVVLETPSRLALISGCSHVGVLNMCRRTQQVFGRPVTDFVGGTHLLHSGEERIAQTCRLLQERGVRRLGACHCSGEQATAYFQANFPGFFYNQVGSRVVID